MNHFVRFAHGVGIKARPERRRKSSIRRSRAGTTSYRLWLWIAPIPGFTIDLEELQRLGRGLLAVNPRPLSIKPSLPLEFSTTRR